MKAEAISFLRINRTPVLAATLVFCLGVTPNTIANGTASAAAVKNAAVQVHENGQVLSQDDETVYRAIFAAQGRGAMKEADVMYAHLHDRRLMGHVLADRYSRQPATFPELQSWMAAYSDLPEAGDVYRTAKKLQGAKNAKLNRPQGVGDMGGNGYGYGTSSGFRNNEAANGPALSALGHRAVVRINEALRQGEPDRAKNMLEAAVQQGLLTENVLVPLQSRLAAGYFYNGNTEEARRLTEASYMEGDARALWISGLSNYQQHNYSDAIESLTTLAGRADLSDGDRAAADFWAYRALNANGDNSEARHWLAEAASQPHSFYGLLASNLSGHDAESAWSWHAPEFNQHATDILANIPAGARALALVQIGQNDMAAAELRHINPQGRRTLQEAMMALAEKGHMASLALKLGGMSTNEEGRTYDAALYPVPAWQPKGGFSVDRALIYALARHESRFDPKAISSQGACGLMQLMPSTAQKMGASLARRRGGECPDQLMDPETNLGFGQSYVRHLAEQPMIGDNLMLLLTAYNGGPGRLSQRGGIEADADPLLFMESLPAQETHDYVQQVLLQYWTYRSRLHQPLQSLAQLARGEWPRFALRDTGVRSVFNDVAAKGFDVASNATVH